DTYFFFQAEDAIRYRIVTVFFFQAEDGIRDRNVTGVQTCALPISAEADPPVRDHGLELVDQLRLDVERRALRHAPLDQSVSLLDAEHDLAREHVDGLVLLVVVLEREHVAGLDVKDLPDVAVRAGPNQLVAPGLFDAVGEVGHGRRETRNAKRGTRNSRVGAVASDLALLFRVPTSAFRVLMKSAST